MQGTLNQKVDVMFDTNIFNHIIGDQRLIESIREKLNVYATHVQRDELSEIKDQDDRNNKLSIFQSLTNEEILTETAIIGISRIGQTKITSNVLPTESSIWDISKWDESKWGETVAAVDIGQNQQDFNLYEEILQTLNKKNGSKKNNKQDAIIAETAIKNGLTLVTHDAHLYTIVTQYGGAVANIFALIGSKEYRSI